MIKLLLLILSFNALVSFSLSDTEKPNNVDKKLPHLEVNHKNDTTILNSKQTKNDNSLGESKLKHVQEEPKIKPAVVEQDKTIEKSRPEQNNLTGQNKIEDNAKILPSHNDSNEMAQESTYINTVSMVLISISLMFMLFVAFKTYRRKSRNERIKKYGIRLARGNIEMTPLPLDNDDDDETIFDLKNLPT